MKDFEPHNYFYITQFNTLADFILVQENKLSTPDLRKKQKKSKLCKTVTKRQQESGKNVTKVTPKEKMET